MYNSHIFIIIQISVGGLRNHLLPKHRFRTHPTPRSTRASRTADPRASEARQESDRAAGLTLTGPAIPERRPTMRRTARQEPAPAPTAGGSGGGDGVGGSARIRACLGSSIRPARHRRRQNPVRASRLREPRCRRLPGRPRRSRHRCCCGDRRGSRSRATAGTDFPTAWAAVEVAVPWRARLVGRTRARCCAGQARRESCAS